MSDQSFSKQQDNGYVWQLGRVCEVTDSATCIEFERPKDCARCMSGKGCGQGVFSQLFSRHKLQIRLAREGSYHEGQWVRVGVTSKAVLYSSVLLYAWPLFLFLAVLVIGNYGLSMAESNGGELWLFAGALGMAALGVQMAGRLRIQLMNPILEPWSCADEHES